MVSRTAFRLDPLVLKSTLLNSAEKIRDRNGAAWAPNAAVTISGVYTTNSPLNVSAGAGELDGLQFSKQYLAGQNGPGNVPSLGWDLNNVQTTLVYRLDRLQPGSTLETTLDWFRHVAWTDNNGNGIIDSSDFFSQLSPLANLDLFVYRDDQLIAQSVSMIDNVEELNLTNLTAGNYDIRVNRTSGMGKRAIWTGVVCGSRSRTIFLCAGSIGLRLILAVDIETCYAGFSAANGLRPSIKSPPLTSFIGYSV